jgi:dimethylamine monooxygenase subunit A
MTEPLPAHTPYDGSSRLFTIGLKPLDLADWIEIDACFDDQLREKRRLYAEREGDVFVAEPGSEDGQTEVLQLLQVHLTARFPDRYRRHSTGIEVLGQPALSTEMMNSMPPLRAASLLVQEDLILMRRGENGWRLAAGSLCFPSSWSLREKFGRPLHEIHAPVPAFGPGTRMAELIGRMFDSLKAEQPVQRFNWSVQAGSDLYLPLSDDERNERATARPSRFPGENMTAHAFIRVERQTLRKLPVSGDILFTIRIHLDPLAALSRHPDRAMLAQSFAEQIGALDQAQLDYKGLTADRDRLIGTLVKMASTKAIQPDSTLF